MALALDAEGLVPAEGAAGDGVVRGQRGGQEREGLDGDRRGGEVVGQVRVGLEHDPLCLHLVGDLYNLSGGLPDDVRKVAFIDLLD